MIQSLLFSEASAQESSSSQPQATTTKVVKVHGASHFSDSSFWTGHALSGMGVFVALVIVLLAKGPGRQEAMAYQRAQEASAASKKEKK